MISENNVILIKGNVPGPKKSLVLVKTAIKNQNKINPQTELITYNEVAEENTTEEAPSQTEE